MWECPSSSDEFGYSPELMWALHLIPNKVVVCIWDTWKHSDQSLTYLEEWLSQGFKAGFPLPSVFLPRQNIQGHVLSCRKCKAE